MANGTVQDDIAKDVLREFDRPLDISAMKKLKQFPMLQELGFNGQLGFNKETFHGLQEFNIHMDMYSSTNLILKAAWTVIKSLAPKNPFVELKLFASGTLGKVGTLFKSVHNFDQVFSVNANGILDPNKIEDKINNVV